MSPKVKKSVVNGRLQLEIEPAMPTSGPVSVNFDEGPWRHMKNQQLGKGSLLAKALGFKAKPWKVFDATAGFCHDSFAMLLLGCDLWSAEHQPWVYEIVEEARLSCSDEVYEILKGWRWMHGKATDIMNSQELQEWAPDVIYLDPMYPESKKTALSNKEMQVLRLLNGDREQCDKNLLKLARRVAKKRVVVKRPPKAMAIDEKINFQYRGKAVRFDMYLPGED